jgi:hypothetical protein
MTPTSLEITEAKKMVTDYLFAAEEGTLVRSKDLVRKFGFPSSWLAWVGCWISKHPRSENWSRTHYRIGGKM